MEGLMAVNVTATMRQALQALEHERKRIEQQIDAVRQVLALSDGHGAKPAPKAAVAPATRKRPAMSAKARQATRERMKAYWAKRKAVEAKAK
jgi:hypothetical protein